MNMPMIPDAIEQAAPTRKAIPVMIPIGRPARRRHVRDVLRLDDADDDADEHGADQREHGDRRVLPPDEGVGALADRVADGHHLRRAGVARHHVTGEIQGEEDGRDTGDRDHPGDELHGTSEAGGRSTARRFMCAPRADRSDTRKTPAGSAFERPPARRRYGNARPASGSTAASARSSGDPARHPAIGRQLLATAGR